MKGTLAGNTISGCRLVLQDGGFHIVDSSELAFRLCTIGAFREAYKLAKAVILEPIMNVEVVTPSEFQSHSLSLLLLLHAYYVCIRFCRRWIELTAGNDHRQ